MSETYNEDYYERGVELNISGYSNYRWIPELTIPLAHRIIEFLNIPYGASVLDYGCAKGYLVKALRLLNRSAYGYDISDYAIKNCPHDIKDYITSDVSKRFFEWTICKDVLEHVSYEHIDSVLQHMAGTSNKFFVIVPLAKDGKYVVPSYETDVTHCIREDIDWWSQKFSDNGYNIVFKSFLVKHIKENYANYAEGNGFFELTK
jgi:cyclopropane fatty-acyl-phospholipid synthase-like methyltransferase